MLSNRYIKSMAKALLSSSNLETRKPKYKSSKKDLNQNQDHRNNPKVWDCLDGKEVINARRRSKDNNEVR